MGLELYLISSGVLFFAAFNALFTYMAWGKSHKYLYLSVIAILSASYQYFSYQYYLSNQIADMTLFLKLQVASVFCVYPLFFLFVNTYFKQQVNRVWLTLISGYSMVLFILNLIQPYGIRYAEIMQIESVGVLGSNVTLLLGSPSPFGLAMHIFGLFFISWIVWQSVLLVKQGRLNDLLLFLTANIALMVAAVWSGLIDTGAVQGGYMIGFVLTVMVIFVSFDMHSILKREQVAYKDNQESLDAEAAEKLRFLQAHSFVDDVLKLSPQPMLISNSKGQVIQANVAAKNLWGTSIIDINIIDSFEMLDSNISISIRNLGISENIALEELKASRVHSCIPDCDIEWLSAAIYPVIDKNSEHQKHLVYAFNDISKRMKIQNTLQEVTTSISDQTGMAFYEELVIKLGLLFDSKFAFIGLLNDEKTSITTKAVSMQGGIVENITYNLLDTPCANVVGNDTCIYPRNIQSLFPKDILLQEMGVEGYVGSPILDELGEAIGLLVILNDKPLIVDEPTKNLLEILAARAGAELNRDVALASVRQMAYEDYLTQLPNRAHAYEHLQSMLTRIKGTSKKATLYLIDLDHFKTINDALGHDVGDDVLRQFGRILKAGLPEHVFISRIGGDEFLLVDEGDDQASLTNHLLNTINQPLNVGDHVVDLNSSFGVAIIPTQDDSLLDILRFAELALYKAKQNGRNTFYVYKKELEKNVIERLNVQSSLKTAIAENLLELYYQPQVDNNGNIFGAEALIRWQTEDGFVSPAYFVPLAEETGLIHQLGEWVLEQALYHVGALRKQIPSFQGHISINISAWQFSLPGFVEQVNSTMQAFGIPPSLIMLELTETALLSDVEDAIRKLNELRALGIKIALDDFGTGYSSLAYLRELPIDVLKIDKTFVDDVAGENRSPLTESMISIGNRMDLDVVAEGVEYQTQADALLEIGCSIYQGYHFARPMPFSALLSWIESSTGVSDKSAAYSELHSLNAIS